jgi:hypothetical protein
MQPISVILRHSKIQVPLARLRSVFGSFWRVLFAMLGRYRPFEAQELESAQTDSVLYRGDIPVGAGNSPVQRRRKFQTPRPLFETVANLVVTPGGAGWVEGVLYEKYSSGKPGLRLLAGSNSPKRRVPEGVFIQSEHIDTFGDWMAEYLAPLARASVTGLPVFLPAALARRGYVTRDAARLGIEFVSIDEPLLIECATVVMQPKVVRYWTKDCVLALRGLLNVEAPPPDPGSLLYLSRHGEASMVADRTHPSLLIEDIVRAHGGKVLRTYDATLDDYLRAGADAETLLFDHGSAAYNMVYWRPQRVIEFTSDDWWMNSFLFFADALGVDDYTILRSDLPDVAARLDAALKTQKERREPAG